MGQQRRVLELDGTISDGQGKILGQASEGGPPAPAFKSRGAYDDLMAEQIRKSKPSITDEELIKLIQGSGFNLNEVPMMGGGQLQQVGAAPAIGSGMQAFPAIKEIIRQTMPLAGGAVGTVVGGSMGHPYLGGALGAALAGKGAKMAGKPSNRPPAGVEPYMPNKSAPRPQAAPAPAAEPIQSPAGMVERYMPNKSSTGNLINETKPLPPPRAATPQPGGNVEKLSGPAFDQVGKPGGNVDIKSAIQALLSGDRTEMTKILFGGMNQVKNKYISPSGRDALGMSEIEQMIQNMKEVAQAGPAGVTRRSPK